MVQRLASQTEGTAGAGDQSKRMQVPLSTSVKENVASTDHAEGKAMTAVLSLSGQTRTQGKVCKQQLEMIVQANPKYTFDVFHVSDTPPNETCVAATRAQPNVRTVTVVPVPESEITETCSHHNRLCPQLLKQRICRDSIYEHSADNADVYIHTRFDLSFDSPLIFEEMPVENYFYVFRNPPKKDGDINDQKTHPFVWNGKYSLVTSAPDYGFVGNWKHVSAALGRLDLAWSLEAGNTTATCFSEQYAGHCQDSPEEFFLETLKREGIWFEGSPPVQLLFARPIVDIIRG